MKRCQILDGSWLKLIAVITMLADHIASALLRNDYTVLLSLGGRTLYLYEAMRYVGRISFPIFAFLLVEGFLHTRNVKRYAGSLLLFALLSEIPWDLEHSGNFLQLSSQNVMFTLLLGLLGLWVIRDYHGQWIREAGMLLGLLAASVLLHADYGISGFGFILMLYLLREQKLYRAVVGSCFLSSTWVAGLGFIPIALYNGKRGFIGKGFLKYVFYAIYPLHMLVLYWIRMGSAGY